MVLGARDARSEHSRPTGPPEHNVACLLANSTSTKQNLRKAGASCVADISQSPGARKCTCSATPWTQVQEEKGLDQVRRDWCPLSKECGRFALRNILSGAPPEDVVQAIHDNLRAVRDQDPALPVR